MFKVGDIVVYENNFFGNKHECNGSKYQVTRLVKLTEKDKESDWVTDHGATYMINIKYLSGKNIMKIGAFSDDPYFNVVFKKANGELIKQKLGVL